MGRKKIQADQRADLCGKKFIGLPVVVKESDAYQALDFFQRNLLIELLSAFNGYNNGKLVISQRQIADRMGTQNFARISSGIARLMAVGLLDISTESMWKERKAREYRLTFISSGSPPNVSPATNDYQQWKNDAEHASAETLQSADHASADGNNPADHASAAPWKNREKCVEQPVSTAEHASSLIGKPFHGSANGKAKRYKYDEETSWADLASLRDRISEHLDQAEPGEQTRLARRLDIPGGTLSKFLSGKGLPQRHRDRLARVLTT